MNWISRFSVVLVLSASAFLFFSMSPRSQADPVGPVVTGGESPWANFTGSIAALGEVTVLTVPGDRIFVLTTFCGQLGASTVANDQIEIRQGATVKLKAGVGNSGCLPGEMFTEGRARMVFEPGTDLILEYLATSGSANDVQYFVSGFYAAP